MAVAAIVLHGTAAAQRTTEVASPVTETQEENVDEKICYLLARIDSLAASIKEILEITPLKGRYKLYPTENIYTLLELDTQTGKIKQVQWSLDSENEGTMIINAEDLSFGLYDPGAFELYPTKNMYQFILIDTILGRKWHVQWGDSDNKRWMQRIW